MKELIIEILNFFKLAFWVEIFTDNPKCTYYFGPFLGLKEAEEASLGYIEDLRTENAQGIRSQVKRMKPSTLTICEDIEDNFKKTKTTSIISEFF